MASFDQFNNLVLLDTVERRIVRLRRDNHGSADGCGSTMMQCFYYDVPMGIFLVRGDSMVLMGAVNDDDDNDDDNDSSSLLRPVSSLAQLAQLQKMAEAPVKWDFDGDLIA